MQHLRALEVSILKFTNNRKSIKTVLLGSGTYAASILMPAMSKTNLLPHLIVSKSCVTRQTIKGMGITKSWYFY